LGTALSERLLTAGYRVTGFDTAPEKLADLRCLGGEAARSAAEAAAASERVLLSLPTSEVARIVLDEIAPVLGPGSIVIDTTTGEPDQIAGFGQRLAARGLHYLDATIGGSSRQVREGQAIVMAGGDPAVFERCRDLFAAFAGRAFHAGPCGCGARMKLVFNLALGLHRAVLAEALAFARASGIDPATALEVLQAGAAYSRIMDTKGHKMVAGDFTPEARLSQHLKDVNLILDAAAAAGVSVPLTATHRALLERAEALGLGGSDNSALIQVYTAEGTPCP